MCGDGGLIIFVLSAIIGVQPTLAELQPHNP